MSEATAAKEQSQQPDTAEVDIGNGQRVPIAELLSMADPHCRFCVDGIQRYHDGARERTRLCGCAVRRMRRKLAGETPSEPLGRVVKNVTLEQERARKRIDRIEKELGDARSELDRRTAGHDAGIAEAEEALRLAGVQVQESCGHLKAERDELARLVAEVELAQDRVADRASRYVADLDAAEARKRELDQVHARSASILESAGKVRHRIERLEARAAAVRAQHPGVS